MVDIHDIPPEVLAAAFEIGIHTWGIGFIHPIAMVCSEWRDIIDHTPRLWGIITMSKRISQLEKQIIKAKESPLSIINSSNIRYNRAAALRVINHLVALSHNWVMADVGTDFISFSRWALLRYSLEELILCRSGKNVSNTETFFHDGDGQPSSIRQPNKLCSFTAKSLPRAWIVPFLSPSIRHFCLERGHSQAHYSKLNIRDTWDYLTRIPNATSIDLVDLDHSSSILDNAPTARLVNLQTLQLRNVLFPSTVLSAIAAPNLKTLIIDHKRPDLKEYMWWRPSSHTRNDHVLAPFFAQWSQPEFVPTNLHTLDLKECLELSDVPYLVRWLERLPNLVRLFVKDDVISQTAVNTSRVEEGEDTNLYRALSSPRMMESGKRGWLCPCLMIFYLDTDQDSEIGDLVSLAEARGGRASPPILGIDPPARLRRIETRLCPDADPKDRAILSSLVDQVYCICTNCGLGVDSA